MKTPRTADDRQALFAVSRAIKACISLISILILIGCGALDNSTTTKRDYRLYLNSGDQSLNQQFQWLVDDFNESLGYRSLSFSANPGNSPVALITGLETRTGKLGFGGEGVKMERSGLNISRLLFMQIELDSEYVQARTPSWPGTEAYQELRLLFFHEIGHGYGLPHAQDSRDVMYAKINSSEKDYPEFFTSIRKIIKN